MFLFPVIQECSCFAACRSLIDPFPDSSTYPFQPLFMSGCMYFLHYLNRWLILDIQWASQLHFLSSRIFGVMKFSHFRGYALFLSLHTQYPLSKYIERDRAIKILMSIFSFKMSTFVCVFICSISSYSPSQSPLVVDTSSISMIPPTSLSLIHVCTQNLYILSLVSAS